MRLFEVTVSGALPALVALMLTVAATAEAVTTAGDVVQRIEGVDVVILGEVHDDPRRSA